MARRPFSQWLLANIAAVTLTIAIAEAYKWRQIAKGWLNRPSIPAEFLYVCAWLVLALLLAAVQVAICAALPTRRRGFLMLCGAATGIALPVLGIVPAHAVFSVYGVESLMLVCPLFLTGIIAGALTGGTTRRS
jgi:hypothetical protein